MIYVVGSGPSGIACARMLLKNGRRVTMLDVGLELEESRAKIVRHVHETHPNEWNETFLTEYKSGFQVNPRGGECKPSYGSLFAYRDVSPFKSVYKNFKVHASYARGGLSNVWGASVLTYSSEDIHDWPITCEDLKPYYQEVFSFLPTSLDPRVPVIPEYLSSDSSRELKMSQQVMKLSRRFGRPSGHSGMSYGGSRLAVDCCKRNSDGKECVYCGLCMYGCPYSLIYNSASTLSELQKDKNFSYIPGIFVEHLKETGGEVRIYGRDLSSNQSRVFWGQRAYLACGVFSSARVLLHSYESYDRPLFGLDSHYFLLPLMSLWGSENALKEKIHTLAQVCFWTHIAFKKRAFMQIYGYNDLYAKEVKFRAGFSYPVLQGVLKHVLERLYMIQGFLHSDDSASIKVELKRTSRGEDELHLEGIMNPKMFDAIRDVKKEMAQFFRKGMIFPVFPMMDVGTPGRGYHSGGTFPMRVSPHFGESDLLGRPYGFKNVHLVDASVFPTIPAGPITLNAMANASRIADQSIKGLGTKA